MSRPSNMICPPVGSSSRVSSRPVVVLPQPDSPTSAERLAAAHVEVEPVDGLHRADLALQQTPGVTGKCFSRPVTDEQRLARPASRGRRGRLAVSRVSLSVGMRVHSRQSSADLARPRSGPLLAAGRWQATQVARADLAAARARSVCAQRRRSGRRRRSAGGTGSRAAR